MLQVRPWSKLRAMCIPQNEWPWWRLQCDGRRAGGTSEPSGSARPSAGAPVPGRSVGSGVDHVSPRSRDAARKNRQSVVGHLEVATITHPSHYGIIRHDTIHRAPLGEVVGVRHIRADGAMRWRFATSGVEGRSSV